MHKIGKILFAVFFVLTTPCIIKSMSPEDQKKLRMLINNDDGPLAIFQYGTDVYNPNGKIDKEGNLVSHGWIRVKAGKNVYVKVTAINKEGGWYRVEYATPHPKKGEPEILPTGLFYWQDLQEIKPKYNDTISYTFNKGIYRGNDKKKTIWDPKGKSIHPSEKIAEKFINGSNAWHP
jgi:hypothetical protein